MPRLTRESIILVGNKEFKVEDLLKTIIYLPAVKVKSYFKDLGLSIPRELRMYVLKENLREKVVETRKSRLTMADEINYRLSWFTEFSETQLENLLVFFDDERIFRNYLEDFWTDLLGYMVEKQVPPKDFKHLYDSSIDHVKAEGLSLPEIKTYNRNLKDIFYDSFGRIDGLAPQKLRPVLYKSSTLGEIRDLGTKYGVSVPRRLKKSQLAKIIIQELKDDGKYTEELEKKIQGMSVIVLQRFAINHDIKASTELKKEEIIEYILKNAEETKETYFVPDSIEDYEKEIHDVSSDAVKENVKSTKDKTVVKKNSEDKQEPQDIVEEEIFIEEDIIEVVTKVEPEEKPLVQNVQSNLNFDELIYEIRKLREAIEKNQMQLQNQTVKEQPLKQEPEEQSKTEEIIPEPIVDSQKNSDDKQESEILKSTDDIDQQEEESTVLEDKESSDKKSKKVGKVILKLLLIALIVVAVVAFLLLAYGLLTYYTQINFLDSVNTLLNRLTINGTGLLDFIHNLFSSIGI